jgi:hypothetical protein
MDRSDEGSLLIAIWQIQFCRLKDRLNFAIASWLLETFLVQAMADH